LPTYQQSKTTNTQNISKNKCPCTKANNCPTNGIIENIFCSKYSNYLKAISYLNDVVPKIYSNVSFTNFKTTNSILEKALNKIIHYVDNKLWQKGSGLILYGGYGTGKTRLGYTILKEIATMGGIIGVIDVLHDFETFEQANESLKAALKSQVILIDDLGAKTFNWINDKIRVITDEANRNQKSLIISTNINPKELISSLELRTASRLTELIPQQAIIYLGEEDFRIHKRQEKEKEWN
jgi:DNA replication protein DnaC